jgi:hypothetical protein
MKIFGGHILKQAMRVVGTQTVMYQKWLSRTTNAAGYDVSDYDTPVGIQGQVQPVNRAVYAQMGLQMSKNYVNLFSEYFIGDLARDRAGDRFTYAGVTYEVMTDSAWKAQQGYSAVMGIQIS